MNCIECVMVGGQSLMNSMVGRSTDRRNGYDVTLSWCAQDFPKIKELREALFRKKPAAGMRIYCINAAGPVNARHQEMLGMSGTWDEQWEKAARQSTVICICQSANYDAKGKSARDGENLKKECRIAKDSGNQVVVDLQNFGIEMCADKIIEGIGKFPTKCR